MFRQRTFFIVLAALLILPVVSGKAQPSTNVPSTAPVSAGANQQTFQVKGVVKELKPDGRTIVIKHEEVTNYMPAMTMPFEVKNPNELGGLQPGDAVGFQMIVSNTDAWIERLTRLDTNPPRLTGPAPRLDFRLVRDVDPLNVGDLLPEYHFTNELGRAISTRQFMGRALAFTFFFTRCPYPAFCPLMSANFDAAQKKLLAMTNAPANWHLLSISFDTENDSPAELKTYAGHYYPQSGRWSFVTGDLAEITAIGDQFGEYFGHDETGGIVHNLRTVVVDTRGRVQKIFTDNKWTGDDLLAEIIKAAAVKP